MLNGGRTEKGEEGWKGGSGVNYIVEVRAK